MNIARQKITKKSTLAIVFLLAAATFFPSGVMAAAGGVQNCTASTTCTIGEFLYDDSAAPIAGATCTITSKYPDRSSFLSSQALSGGGADGWYYYEFTAPATTGMYATSVSCTVSADSLSIDKSFDVVTASSSDPNAVASAVWNYSTRTVSSFGSLVSDIWNSATRSLTESSSSNTSNTTNTTNVTNVTNTTNNSVIDTINHIKSTTDKTRLLLEQIVNKPIIENVLEDTATPITEKLDGTRAQANQMYINNQFLTTQSAKLASSWNTTSGKDILDSVIAISGVVGESSDASNTNSMFGISNWINDSWNWNESVAIKSQLTSMQNTLDGLKTGLVNYQKSPALLAQVKQLAKTSLALEKTIGVASDTIDKKTLFSKIKITENLALELTNKDKQIAKVLYTYFKSKDYNSVAGSIKDLQNQVIALNKVPGGISAITKINSSDSNSVTNNILSLKGIVKSNEKLLSVGSGHTMVNVWLEVGSIIFKTVATNPSTLISQKVDIKYYLPEEIKAEDVVKTDAGLSVNYDAEKNQLYVSGTFNLAAGQSRTFSVETKDIWAISSDELVSLKRQANDLYQPLQKTSFYAQAVSLKSDINANLEQIENLEKGALTPEEKIRAYRESSVLKKSVDEKLLGMKELIGQASAAGSLFGFVGGAQTIAVWGIIIIVAAGFIFMATYMRALMAKPKAKSVTEDHKPVAHHSIHPLGFAAIMIATSIISAGTTGLVVNNVVSRSYQEKFAVLGAQAENQEVAPTPLLNDAKQVIESNVVPETNLGQGGQYIVVIGATPTGLLNVRQTPAGMKIVAQVKTGDKLQYIDENIKYFNVKLENGETGWVSKEFTTKE